MSRIKDPKDKNTVAPASEAIKEAAEYVTHPSDESDKEARIRQPWMPMLGSILVGLILLAIFMLFMGMN
jgi:hypothetical protein